MAGVRHKYDVYVDAGLYRCPRRGGAGDVSALVGLWADIDIASPVHKKRELPRDGEEAREILRRLPCWPSIIVHSGHGLQCWWLFRKPLVIETDMAHRRAAGMAKGWNDFVRRAAGAAGGWDVDATGDLARVLRVPGTMNRKSRPALPVKIVEPNALGDIRRYRAADFQEFVGTMEWQASKTGPVGPLRLDPKAEPPRELLVSLLASDEKFRRTWERRRPELQDQSPSAFDMSVASMAAAAGWTDQEIVNLLIAACRKHGDDLKLRHDYYQRTLARARADLGNRPGGRATEGPQRPQQRPTCGPTKQQR